jgi:penicillin amidase/acyl-homoserine-lactone acylase
VLLEAAFPITGRDIAAASVHKSPLFFGLEQTLARLFAMETREDLAAQPTQSPAPLAFAERRFGSNTFAIGPERTTDGSTFLAVNSHQPWEGPVAWYEAHVHSEAGWDAVGGLFPGSPVIIHGHNRDLGWAFTVNQADLVDVYELTVDPEDPDRYLFDGSWQVLETRVAVLRVKIVGRLVVPVRREVLWSVHGPVIRNDAGTFAVRYAGAGRVDIWEQLYRMNRAETFDTWLSAARLMALPTFNIGYADRVGNIYYLFNASLPLRDPDYDWSGILPGDTSDTLWEEYLPFDELPQVFNPPAGFIQNANNTPFQTTLGAANPDPEQYDATLGIETRMSNRALRALELFSADPALTWDAFVAYKFDVTYSSQSDLARYVATLVSSPDPEDPALAEAMSILRAWDLTAAVDSSGATLGILLLDDLSREISGFDVSETVGVALDRAVLLASLERVVDRLNAQFGRVDVPWGEVNRLQRGAIDLPLAGGPDLLHAIYGSPQKDGRLMATSGDSYVLLARWDASGTVTSVSIHQFGSATRDPASSHFADQAPLFARRELKPVWLDESEIRANLDRAYRPGQRDGQ